MVGLYAANSSYIVNLTGTLLLRIDFSQKPLNERQSRTPKAARSSCGRGLMLSSLKIILAFLIQLFYHTLPAPLPMSALITDIRIVC